MTFNKKSDTVNVLLSLADGKNGEEIEVVPMLLLVVDCIVAEFEWAAGVDVSVTELELADEAAVLMAVP